MPQASAIGDAQAGTQAPAGSVPAEAAGVGPGRPLGAVTPEVRRLLLRDGSTLAPIFPLLPRSVRGDIYLLYRVFRTLDDLVDRAAPAAEERLEAVERWCRGAAPASEEARILEALSAGRPLPVEPWLDFCEAMRQDLGQGSIETEADLDRYCYQVGGTVGVLSAAVLGARGAEAEGRAGKLGMAVQRTHILRDLDEDLAEGRLYVARESIERFGFPSPGGRAALMRDQIARADALFEEGIAGIRLFRRGRRAVSTAAALYREILRQIERDGYDKKGRPIVSRPRRLAIVARRAALPF